METAEELKADLQRRGIYGLALDIDQTLSYTNEHWWERLIVHHPPPMSRQEVFRRQLQLHEVPEWQTPAAVQFAYETLHSNEFQETVPLIEGADTAVAEINGIVPIVAYITARPATVRTGTLNWLRKHGFPEAALIMRDVTSVDTRTLEKDKNVWKAGVLRALCPEVIGIVDDNSLLAHELEKLEYNGMLYLYGPQQEKFDDYLHITPCPTWADVVAAIKS